MGAILRLAEVQLIEMRNVKNIVRLVACSTIVVVLTISQVGCISKRKLIIVNNSDKAIRLQVDDQFVEESVGPESLLISKSFFVKSGNRISVRISDGSGTILDDYELDEVQLQSRMDDDVLVIVHPAFH